MSYFAYLIYSYIERHQRGENLLIENGERRLNQMIDELREEQRKNQWELEMTERDMNRV